MKEARTLRIGEICRLHKSDVYVVLDIMLAGGGRSVAIVFKEGHVTFFSATFYPNVEATLGG